MTEFALRPVRPADREELIKIFEASFGDGEAFVRELLSPELLSSACCGEIEGRAKALMLAFHGQRWGGRTYSYLYALCTAPESRGLGLGKALAEYSVRRALELGADGAFLRAGDPGLQGWYESMGALAAAPAAPAKLVPDTASEKAFEISARQYAAIRKGDWELTAELLEAQACIHRHYGGAFLRLGDDCLCAEKREYGVLIRELCASEPGPILAAAAEHFSVGELYILSPDADRVPSLYMPPLPDSVLPEAPFLFPLD